ncbi:MAG: PAS domain S-box protein [Deltaproteobacteria bacterium]|nr:PAS domain S-box protein [Deltaproteobacteria bacterium]
MQEDLKKSCPRAADQLEADQRAERRYRALLDFLPDPVFVFNLDGTVYYVNPAFVKVFGWTLSELKGKRIPFIPEHLKEETRLGTQRLFKDRVVHGVETKRLTKDGRVLDILLDAAIFYEEQDEPAGHVVILRDITQAKRAERTNASLFRISRALPRFRALDPLLEFIAKEIKGLLSVQGAMVILLDEEKGEFFFRVAEFDDTETGKKFKEVRFPVNKGVAGEVYRTGKPIIVPDTSKNPHFYRQVDQQAGYETRSMLDVPMWIQDRFIGVLCAVNKKEKEFDHSDVSVLSTIASMVALPIENARINDELNRSYEEVQVLNRAKDRVIHHLSHELKTPVAVLAASLGLLEKMLSGSQDKRYEKILERARRNLHRILEMQYEIEDILREKDYRAYYLISKLLEACTDELETLAMAEFGDVEPVRIIRSKVEALFGPRHSPNQKIWLHRFVSEQIERLEPKFSHRNLKLITRLHETSAIAMPPEVLTKIIEGLIRNAVENTPDGGRIEVGVENGKEGPELCVKDYGVGITQGNQRLIFENYFTARDPLQYASRRSYDFNAGGKGFDLLRMKFFSEQYKFKIQMESKRCRFIPSDTDPCPGIIGHCTHCHKVEDCLESGGTTVIVKFSAVHP